MSEVNFDHLSNVRQATWNQPAPLLSVQRGGAQRSVSPGVQPKRIGMAVERVVPEVEGFVKHSGMPSAFQVAVKGTISTAHAREALKGNPQLLEKTTDYNDEQLQVLQFENERLMEEVAELRLVNGDLRARTEVVESELIKSNERARLDLEVSQLETDVIRLTRELQKRNEEKVELKQQVDALTMKLESQSFLSQTFISTREAGNSDLERQLVELEEQVGQLLPGLAAKMNELEAANQQLAELQRENDSLRAENAELISTARELQIGLQEVNYNVTSTTGGYDQAQVDAIQRQISDLIVPLNSLLEEQQASYDKLLAEKRRLERENKEKEARFEDLERQIEERTKELRILEGDKKLIQNFNEKLLRQRSYSKIKVPDVSSLDTAVKTIQQLTKERDILAAHLQNFTYSAEAVGGGRATYTRVTDTPAIVSSVLRQNNSSINNATNVTHHRSVSPQNNTFLLHEAQRISTNKVRFQEPQPADAQTLAPPPWLNYNQTSVERK